MQQLLFSPAAYDDLVNIYDYTAQTWGIDQAEHYVHNLHGACHDLALGNRIGRKIDFIRQGYYKQSIGAHFVFYRHPKLGILEVVRILHQQMDIEAHLN